ncbi:MAG: hypothetical protein CMB56_002415 [Methanobacteriota archaeon]|nr:MAG: hypothetical protein CMB56_002415 [Euryarchaeota archaeon]|tara:strand:+ start:218 stop:463 length:246 start_codon:yes stop_codon:yes gene_type:complete
MGAGSAPEVKLPDVGLVFGISLLVGYVLMFVKSGSDFSEHLFSNFFMILIGFGLAAYGFYFNYFHDRNEVDEEIIEAEILN